MTARPAHGGERSRKYPDAERYLHVMRRLGWKMDACGDAAIVYAPDGRQFSLRQLMPTDRLVTVCDHCLRACCWHGIFMCHDSDIAGVVDLPRNVLRLLDAEHEDYFSDAALMMEHTGQ